MGGGGGEEVITEHLGQLLKLSPHPGILMCLPPNVVQVVGLCSGCCGRDLIPPLGPKGLHSPVGSVGR